MFDKRMIAKNDNRTVVEQCNVDGVKYVFDFDLGRPLSQHEIERGIVFNYDLDEEQGVN